VRPPKLQAALNLLDAGKLDEARAGLVAYLPSDPGNAHALHALMFVDLQLGRVAEGLETGRRALEKAPNDLLLLNNFAHLNLMAGNAGAALEAYERTLKLDPSFGPGLVGVTLALLRANRPAEALARADAGLRIRPYDPMLLDNKSGALFQLGRMDEAIALLRDATRRHPENLTLAVAHASCLNYSSAAGAKDILEAHRRAGRLMRRLTKCELPPPAPPREPERTLRVGIVSNDLRTHPVGSFVEPFFLLPRPGAPGGGGAGQFEVVAYYTAGVSDAVTERLRSRASLWRDAAALSAGALAKQIRADRIDIVVELSGVTVGNRLQSLICRPAPVQMTAIGYPSTTGVEEIGWRLSDSIVDPPGEADGHGVEKVLRLDPCFLCYRTPRGSGFQPESSGHNVATESQGLEARATTPRPFTFGSFNALPKIDDATVRIWAAVLGRTPGSRLLYKAHALADPNARGRLLERFVAAGMDASRLELLGPAAGAADHLATYGRVDLALDTFPYNGTTTTCEAMFMGVPVLTLEGDRSASRVGATLLSAVGLPELIATSEEEYVSKAQALAGDAARLGALRAGLRERLLASPLCDEEGYTSRLASALRQLWREACARV
jgi:protein O-GlcNAc transferase